MEKCRTLVRDDSGCLHNLRVSIRHNPERVQDALVDPLSSDIVLGEEFSDLDDCRS